MVVATTDATWPLSVGSKVQTNSAHIIANLDLDNIDKNVEKWDSLDHHRAVAAREDATSE
jgi:hypothetical protein